MYPRRGHEPGSPSSRDDGSLFPFLTSTATPTSASASASATVSASASARRSLAGHATPPHYASGMNRLPVITRSSRAGIGSAGSSSSREQLRDGSSVTNAGGKYFDPPSYLRQSNYWDRMWTMEKPRGQGEGSSSARAGRSAPSNNGAREPARSDMPGTQNAEAMDTDATMSGERRKLAPQSGLPLKDKDAAPILLPTCWSEYDKCNLLDLDTQCLHVRFNGTAKYGDRDAAAVRANRPAPSQAGVYYFEVAVTDKGSSGYIGIGFSHAVVSLSRLPGWEDRSWGYHGDDGRAFCCLGTGETFGPTFTTGDVVGCGIDWTDAAPLESRTKEKVREKDRDSKGGGKAFFTKNGEFLGYAFANLHGDLYPSVGLRTPGEVVVANFGAEPFRFDIDSLVRERHRTLQARLAATSIPPSMFLPDPASPPIPALLPTSAHERTHEALQSFVTRYLEHHGYADTANAFARQVKEERVERAEGLVPGSAATASINGAETPASEFSNGSFSTDISARSFIKQSFLAGDMERVIQLTRTHFPRVLLEDPLSAAEGTTGSAAEHSDGGMLFKLRLRQFIEAVRAVSVDAKDGSSATSIKGKGKRRALHDTADDVDMATAAPSALDTVLALGQQLSADYQADTRSSVQKQLTAAFSLMAYDRPMDVAGEIGWLVSDEAREKAADELNSAILVSQSLPPIPHFEAMYRQAAASVALLGDLGHGAGAYVNPREEILGQRERHGGYIASETWL